MSDRDELLKRLVTGEPLQEAERASLEGDAEAAELEALVGELDRAGEVQRRRILERARASGEAPGEARTGEILARLGRGGSPRWLAAAAVILALVGLWWIGGIGPRHGDGNGGTRIADNVMLSGAEDLVDLRLDPGPDDSVLATWRLRGDRPRARFHLLFYDAQSGSVLDQVRDLETTTWTIPAAQHGSWPESIRWEVRAYDVLGGELGVRSATARLLR